MSSVHHQETILSVNNLSVTYGMTGKIVYALNDISFELQQGKTLGIVGESGCGKSTVAKAVMGLLPNMSNNVTNGEIIFEGEDLLKASKEEMRRIRGKKITMIFQDPMTALNPVMRVGSQIVDIIRAHETISRRDAKKRAKELLKMVGISEERFREYPHQFSGGMKQRVVIAIALACNPELLIADEPTTALDVTIQADILELIRSLQQARDMAMLVITHDLGIVAETCDYVAVLYAGQIVEYGTVEQVFENTRHPYTEGLFKAIPDIEIETERLTPIPGNLIDPSNLPAGCFFSPRCPYATEQCREGAIPMETLLDGHWFRCIRHKDGYKNNTAD